VARPLSRLQPLLLPETKLDGVMQSIETLLETLKKNDEITRKFQEIETKILSILEFTDLFEILLDEIRQKFQVPYVWLTLIDTGDESGLLQFLEHSKILETNLNIVSSDTFFKLVPRNTEPLLVNDDMKPYYRLLPPIKKILVKSMAIAPITMNGQIIGSLNQADFSYLRFAPGIDTSLLEQLAIKVSLCLANVTAHEKLKFLAYHDPLTGSLNRRVMESILKREFMRARRYNSPLSLVFLDIDYFKKINDHYGHDAGDQVLIHLARGMESMVRNSDVVARFAGDEFIVILPETAAKKAASMMARIKDYFFQTPLRLEDAEIPVSISFGVASIEDKTIETPEALIKAADGELYRMKENRE
jgi:diguanylate cyclase (GGDEF)-like protein